MRQLGQAETTVVLGNTYLDVMAWGFFPALGFALLRSVVAAMSHTRIVMAIAIGGTIVNIIGDYVLGFGKFGLPQLGIAGLALASILAFWGIGLTIGYWLGFQTSLGGSGLWIGQSIGIAISAVMFFWRFNRIVAQKYQ
jgi:multidrug resistance protein, MATE family